MVDKWNGLPENPERDGWHWVSFGGVVQTPWRWLAPVQLWDSELPIKRNPLTREDIQAFRYLAPCLTPAEVASLVENARREEREADAAIAGLVYEHARDREARFCGFTDSETGAEAAAEEIVVAIRARSAT
jgi:hypothetical protein